MYAYIKGIITGVTPKYIVLENNNIGYLIIVGNPYNYEVNVPYTVYVYQNIKEDCNDIYGFSTKDEKELFLKLINVTGIGPKSALSILASGTVSEISAAITSGDANYLKKFPGIGQKASMQIILDLKGKLDTSLVDVEFNKKLEDVSEALVALGYNQKEIKKVLGKLDQSLSTSLLIKQALKEMNK